MTQWEVRKTKNVKEQQNQSKRSNMQIKQVFNHDGDYITKEDKTRSSKNWPRVAGPTGHEVFKVIN